MNSNKRLKTKLSNEGVDRIDLLTHRVQENTLTGQKNTKRNAREPGSRTHIKKTLRLKRQNLRQRERIDDMQNKGVMNICNASEIHVLVDLVDHEQVANAKLGIRLTHIKLHLRAVRAQLRHQLSNLQRRLSKLMNLNRPGSFHSHGKTFLQQPVTEISVTRT